MRSLQVGNQAAAREFDVDESCIHRWKTEKKVLEQILKNKRSLLSGTVHWPNLEDNLEQ